MYNYHNIENESNLSLQSIHQRNHMIQKMKQQFASFGYKEIHTPAFQPYDLYVQMNGTVNQQEMIKTIDNTGNVLVLRPDVTIPLTQRIAQQNPQLQQALRYFYVLDVFRQVSGSTSNQENTQVGAEFFGNTSAATDAEVIALSMNVLDCIDLKKVTIELGHAGFFKELITEMTLEKETLNALKQFIRAKNVPEIEGLLQHIELDESLKEIIAFLPFLYGNPEEVINRARALPLTDAMHEKLDNLMETYDYLDAYGMKNHIVVDLSLINHMDYYSDIIFQGFIENIGKPILMGGRYNTLANQFDADIPAVGFACNLDLLLKYTDDQENITDNAVDICIFHTPETIKEAIKAANIARKSGCDAVIFPIHTSKQGIPSAKAIIYAEKDVYKIEHSGKSSHVTSIEELSTFLEKEGAC